MINKTRAGQLAREARQHGHSAYPDGTVSVLCPECGGRVTAARTYRDFPAPRSRPARVDPVTGVRTSRRRETVTEALDRAVTGHLLDGSGCRALAVTS